MFDFVIYVKTIPRKSLQCCYETLPFFRGSYQRLSCHFDSSYPCTLFLDSYYGILSSVVIHFKSSNKFPLLNKLLRGHLPPQTSARLLSVRLAKIICPPGLKVCTSFLCLVITALNRDKFLTSDN